MFLSTGLFRDESCKAVARALAEAAARLGAYRIHRCPIPALSLGLSVAGSALLLVQSCGSKVKATMASLGVG